MATIIWVRKVNYWPEPVKTMRYLIYLMLLVSTSLSAGSIQKWVDENGNVHYGDAPPVETKTESVSVQSAPTNPGKTLPRLNDKQTEGNSGGKAMTEEQSKIACDNARDDLSVLENNTRVSLKDPDGSVRPLTPTEIEERKTAAQADIAKHCI